MSFIPEYANPNKTTTSGSKGVLCKSIKIDIAGGDGFTTATGYPAGALPKDAQVIGVLYTVPTAVSGGTVSAATLAITVGGATVFSQNVFSTSHGATFNTAYMNTFGSAGFSTDQAIVYTPTLTGAGATAGVIYINILYVV